MKRLSRILPRISSSPRALAALGLIFLMANLAVWSAFPAPAYADICGANSVQDQNGNCQSSGVTPGSGSGQLPTYGIGGNTYGAGSSAASGLGSCAVKILGSMIGGSIGAAVAGQALTAGAAANPTQVAAVPTNSVSGNIGRLGNVGTNVASAISSNLNLGINLSNLIKSDVLDCIARAIARALIQQVAVSTINWINSGFNGSPLYLTDPSTFFENVGLQAAGNYIQGSDLAFLCSPFSLQVKIAVAQSYGYNNALSCNLAGNFTSFMNGFQNGGWGSMLSLTTAPNNNPFGAYMTAQAGLNAAVANSNQYYQNQLQQSGGFLNFTQQSCKTGTGTPPSAAPNQTLDTSGGDFGSGSQTPQWTLCTNTTVTPGTVISQSLSKVIGTNLDSLNTAKYFDEIISALVTQLIQRTMGYFGSGGLLGMTSSTGNYGTSFTSSNDALTTLQQDVLGNLPTYQSNAQQLMAIDQQNITNVQASIATTQSALSCWQQAEGNAGAAAGTSMAQSDLATLQGYLNTYTTQYNAASSSIASLEGAQSALSGTSDINTLESSILNFSSNAAGDTYVQQSDITSAQEDQIGVLSGNLATINTQESTNLSSCPQASGISASGASAGIPAPTCALSVNSPYAFEGSSVVLSWTSTNATAGIIDNGAGSVGPSGSQSVLPQGAGTVTYTGTFSGAGGTGTCSVPVSVLAPQDTSGGGF